MPPYDIIKTQCVGPEDGKVAQEINSIVVRNMSWIAQLIRALARKVKGPGSNPGPG